MKKSFLLRKSKFIYVYLFVAALIMSLNACSNSDDGDSTGTTETVDLSVVSGSYIGSLTSPLVSFSISAKLTKVNDNRYSVKLYETSNFVPAHNADGVTPEVTGFIEMDGNNAVVDLTLLSDTPVCIGTYVGLGTRSAAGVFTLTIDFIEDCAKGSAKGTFTYTLRKTAN